MKILAMPLVHMGPNGGFNAAAAAAAGAAVNAPEAAGGHAGQGAGVAQQGAGGIVREHYAPNILKGFWEHRPEQKDIMPRLR